MAKIEWDAVGERNYELGADHGVLYPFNPNPGENEPSYGPGVAWNGLTNVTLSPSGAEANKQYGDNFNYVTLYSAEEFGATIEAFTYPDEFAECDGSAEVTPGVKIGQQPRKTFGFCYRSFEGNDTDGQEANEILHLIYGAKASPSERAYETVNDSPEAITFSWELTTTPINVTIGDTSYKTATLEINLRKLKEQYETGDKWETVYNAIKDALYGTTTEAPYLPTPEEIKTIIEEAAA